MKTINAYKGIFWIIPGKKGWEMLFFPHQYAEQHHIDIWKAEAGPLLLDRFNKRESERFGELYDAYPRGRLNAVPTSSTWMIGFGGDYPPDWNAKRLMRELGVESSNSEIGCDDHWIASTTSRMEADQILGIEKGEIK